ncbi:MAG TPA: MarR family transcriptional regulator [Acidimicrobiales bacterium]|jgi:DNA-binding MarR family transcriptional regulator|nr:MarR family transcriptional regulator [Acidimicrobiales bacterium]
MDERAWLTDAEQRAWRAVVLLQTQLRAVIARGLQRESGLSESDYEVLVHLSEAPDRSLRPYELGERTKWEKSRLSHHLRRMTVRGLVSAVDCPTDNRGTVIVLTDAGWDAISAAAPGHVRHVRKAFIDALSPQELETLGAIGDRLVEVLNLPIHCADEDASACDSAEDSLEER